MEEGPLSKVGEEIRVRVDDIPGVKPEKNTASPVMVPEDFGNPNSAQDTTRF